MTMRAIRGGWQRAPPFVCFNWMFITNKKRFYFMLWKEVVFCCVQI